MRKSLYGAWYKLQAHLAGQYPYLEEIGTLHGCKFTPHNGVLHHKIAYGAICELVQLEMKQQGVASIPLPPHHLLRVHRSQRRGSECERL